MKNVYSDIREARELILSNRSRSFSTLYPFTTENLNGYMSLFDFNKKRVLTVGSSADQILNSFSLGSKDIVCFDRNTFTKYYFDLKKAGIKEFSLEEFVKFFCLYNSNFIKNKEVFNLRDFERLVPYLSSSSLTFWSEILSCFSSYKVRNRLFSSDEYPVNVIKKINNYMVREKYNLLKKSIDELNVTFIHSDIRYVSDLLSGKFDYIMLSNIAAYLEGIYYDKLRGFKNNVLELSDFLNENGVIFLSYLYDYDKDTRVKFYWDLIYHLDLVYREFKGYQVSLESFKGIGSIEKDKERVKDSVLIFKK